MIEFKIKLRTLPISMMRGIAALCASVTWMGASAQSVNDTTAVIDSIFRSLPEVMVSG